MNIRLILHKLGLIILHFAISSAFCQATDSIAGRIMEEKFITINGIEQWVTIKGERSKPIVLFLHGGPGSPLSLYSDQLYGKWEKDFIIVQWDQRGAGRTFGRNAPEELTPEYLKKNPLTVKQITDDGIALAEYLINYLGKQRLILTGTSWGSVPGIEMAYSRPDLFIAYIGHSQIVTPNKNHRQTYDHMKILVAKHNDDDALAVLNTIGPPPYSAARDMGKFLRIIKKYERLAETPPPASWFIPAPQYDNQNDSANFELGDDYSFVNYTGDTQLGVTAMVSGIDLQRDLLTFKIPIYFIQGEEDLLTPKKSTRAYFDLIEAPQKEYFLLPKTAHGFNEAVLQKQYEIFVGLK